MEKELSPELSDLVAAIGKTVIVHLRSVGFTYDDDDPETGTQSYDSSSSVKLHLTSVDNNGIAGICMDKYKRMSAENKSVDDMPKTRIPFSHMHTYCASISTYISSVFLDQGLYYNEMIYAKDK
ncbi:hypothetical protein JW711_04520 [Candidatus Woesearchaeota archaeon]|nr:hypothetical protein [Candidatus Woesearchaeota archaeon]